VRRTVSRQDGARRAARDGSSESGAQNFRHPHVTRSRPAKLCADDNVQDALKRYQFSRYAPLAVPAQLHTAIKQALRNDSERSEIGRQLLQRGFLPIRERTSFCAIAHVERHLEMPRDSIAALLRLRR